MKTEYTLESFRAACTVGTTDNARGYLSGAARPMQAGSIKWEGADRGYEMHFDLAANDPDPVASLYAELDAKCIIRDCLARPKSNPENK